MQLRTKKRRWRGAASRAASAARAFDRPTTSAVALLSRSQVHSTMRTTTTMMAPEHAQKTHQKTQKKKQQQSSTRRQREIAREIANECSSAAAHWPPVPCPPPTAIRPRSPAWPPSHRAARPLPAVRAHAHRRPPPCVRADQSMRAACRATESRRGGADAAQCRAPRQSANGRRRRRDSC